MERRHQVVVVGAGFGGLAVARHLADAPVDLVMVDANNFHTFQPLLYQVATAGLDAEDIAHPVRGIVAKHRNTDVRLAAVVDLDIEGRRLIVSDGPPIEYDQLVLAAGAVTNTYGIPGVDEHGFGLKSLNDALELRAHVLRQFERASHDPSAIENGALTFVIGGAGPTGVELAGGLTELFDRVLSKDFPTLDVRRARVVLVESTDRVLGTFSRPNSDSARSSLADKGVEIVLGTGVASADDKSVELTDGRRIPAATLVWTAGVTASPVAQLLEHHLGEAALTKGSRVVVTRELTVPDHPEIMVIGDLAAGLDEAGDLLPQVAPVAMQQGELVADNIRRSLDGEPLRSFTYRDKGSMATIGRNQAVADLPFGLRLRGTPGWFAWLALHLVMLVGFRNRLNVLLNWAWSYLTYDRASRIIVEPPDRSTISGD